MQADSPIAQRWQLMREHLNERQRRTFAAAEARVVGRGGIAQVVAATGIPATIAGPQRGPGHDAVVDLAHRAQVMARHMVGGMAVLAVARVIDDQHAVWRGCRRQTAHSSARRRALIASPS